MRLLLLGREIRNRSQITNFSGVYSYYLARALREAGVEIVFADPPTDDPAAHDALDLDGIDHIVGLHSRHFDRAHPDCVKALLARFRGAVTQLSDRPLTDQLADCTFCARDDEGIANNVSIGWAADPELCWPEQQPGELLILVDHPDYVVSRPQWDRTATIKRMVGALLSKATLKRYDRITVLEIADGGIIPCNLMRTRPFRRSHIPFETICATYRRASIFLPTHRESLGLTVLETAMCGALTVVPQGYIPEDRLKTVRHIEYSAFIDWSVVIHKINIPASREMALANSWSAVAQRMLDWLP